jgi:hypothetical protein
MDSHEPIHRRAILISNKQVAAALYAKGHRSILVYQGPKPHTFYAAFAESNKIYKLLREIKNKTSTINTHEYLQNFKELEIHLAELACAYSSAEQITA